MDTGASLYDCKVYSCLASRLVVALVKALPTSGVWGDNDEVCGSLESWVVLPELGYLIITRGRSEMDTTGRMKHLLVKIIERVTYSTRIAAVPSECRADKVNGSWNVHGAPFVGSTLLH